MLRMLAAIGLVYLLITGSTFSSLDVVLPHMIAALHMNYTQAGSGFIVLALAAGLLSMLPALGGIAARIGVRGLLVFGLVIQSIGMAVLASGWSVPALILFAIGVGGGYGTLMIGTTLAIETYYGRANFARIFGSNQLFSVISVVGPALAGWIAALTGRFGTSFLGCAALPLAAAGASLMLRPTVPRGIARAQPAGLHEPAP